MISPAQRSGVIEALKEIIDGLQKQEIDAVAVIYFGKKRAAWPWIADCTANALRLSGLCFKVGMEAASAPDAPDPEIPLDQLPVGRGN